jgi:hypothetical protein
MIIESIKDFGVIGLKSWCIYAVLKYGKKKQSYYWPGQAQRVPGG